MRQIEFAQPKREEARCAVADADIVDADDRQQLARDTGQECLARGFCLGDGKRLLEERLSSQRIRSKIARRVTPLRMELSAGCVTRMPSAVTIHALVDVPSVTKLLRSSCQAS